MMNIQIKDNESTATNFDVNEYRTLYVNLPIIITQSCSVPIKTESQIFDKVINVLNVIQH